MKIKHRERFPIWLPEESSQLKPGVFSAFNLFKSIRIMDSQDIMKFRYNKKLIRKGIGVKDPDKLNKRLRITPTPLLMSEGMAKRFKAWANS